MTGWRNAPKTDVEPACYRAVHYRRGARIDFRVVHDQEEPYWLAHVLNWDSGEWEPIDNQRDGQKYGHAHEAQAAIERLVGRMT